MLYSQYLIPTLKETPADAVVPSHILMLRAGMIRRLAAGIYTYLPLGLRTIKKIEAIIREEMDRAGALELLMPAVQPAEIWQESGRWGYYGPELLRFKDRKGGDFCLGPTHEEVITQIARNEISSYRDLPMNLYQIQTKFRDEIRPRFGLMRGREFTMKDAYSFDLDEEGARESYQKMYDAYTRIFQRCGLQFKAVEAGTGAIGGSVSHEFQVLAQSGEDAILACSACDYAANREKAECRRNAEYGEKAALGDKPGRGAAAPSKTGTAPLKELAAVDTPDVKTIEELAAFLQADPKSICKTLIYMADRRPVAVMLRGDHEISETKLTDVLQCDELVLADDATIQKVSGAPTGFAGPVGLGGDTPAYADHALEGFSDGVAGANEKDKHFVHVYAERDFPGATTYRDLRLAQEGEPCPRCGSGAYESYRGIEVGQVFYLGTKYSERMNASVLDENGKSRVLVMGCYGIGVGRTMAAAIEQNHDEHGIIWPISIAPFQLIICPVGGGARVEEVSRTLYRQLSERGIEVLLDDRGERPGVMFNDADLTGIPLRLTVGQRTLAGGRVELKWRGQKETAVVEIAEAPELVEGMIEERIGR
jgi:prolyl-tRNA synthetase